MLQYIFGTKHPFTLYITHSDRKWSGQCFFEDKAVKNTYGFLSGNCLHLKYSGNPKTILSSNSNLLVSSFWYFLGIYIKIQ